MNENYVLIGTHHTKLIVDSLPGIFYVIDHTGRFIYWNKNFEILSGYSAKEIEKMHPLDFFEGEEKILLDQQLQKVFSEGSAEMDAYLVSKSNDHYPFYLSGVLVDMDGIPCIIGMGIDITRRRKAEKKLQESEEQYRLIVETAQEGIWLIDEYDVTTFVNKPMAEMLGYTREEMIGRPLHYFMNKEEKAIADQNLERRRQGLADEHEFAFQKKNDELIWTHLHTNPIFKEGVYKGALAMITDITERKEAEQRLLLSEQKFKSLVQNGSDLIAVIDESGFYKYVSPTVTGILKYDPNFFEGKNIYDFIHKEDKVSISKQLSELFSGKELLSSPYRFLHNNGEWRWLESRGTNLLDDPAIKGLVINSRDITERITLQEELDRRSRVVQKEMTAAVISAQENERSQLGQELHDNVNQVLTTVKLYNEMLRDGLGNPQDLINKSINHLQSCINEIRSISKRLSAPTLGHISLQDSIKELVESVNLIKRVNIIYTIDGFINAIASQEVHLAIYRIVQEQLNNILKYAEASFATIEIAVKRDWLHLIIKDDGKGFDVSQKTEGIGITNMKSRAENLNGSFEIRSAPGHGCTVKVKIPLQTKTVNT